MKLFESPLEFEIKKIVNNYEFSYDGLTELCQGGPEIGLLYKNGNLISNQRFGGPFIFTNEYIFIPVYVKTILKSGFKLAKINIEDLSINEISSIKEIIFIDRIDKNRLYYFEDLNQQKLNYFDV